MTKQTALIRETDLIRHTLTQPGIEVEIWNYGGIINDIRVADRDGRIESVVLGFDTLKEYRDHSPYFGAIVGRVAGRIGQAQMEVEGTVYPLAANDGRHHLHGGIKGFDQTLFDIVEAATDRLHLRLVSPDGTEGYPGNVTLDAIYQLDGLELTLTMHATTDQTTPLNLTNHTYWNLSGNLQRDILDHQLTIPSEMYLPVGADLLPTGELRDVTGTPLDFRSGRSIRNGAESDHPETVAAGHGYDHPFLLSGQPIRLEDPASGRSLEVTTNQPVVILYTGTQLETDYEIRGVRSRPSLGLCLETQVHPNAVNEPSFPDILVKPNQIYHWEMTYRFGVNND
ncbi:Aldose 1-epimerase [Exiguobacterium sibiricum 255-15]|uniref:Aldose 1-epimerase n=1 Tax=Exiguobacterium sibiricum (strain DSM 17290 / CCUG 55495 / CIP 109462 / JCM 13490 / 255-15) TaxID=262543 RepID=B1YII1_EXIS2|nr:aldose epimerase family protein [Exiguobacterium sibiricum]ACB59864.1 Aldose 1-epimerase [Exiguobacterium sibiricum 255-15]